MLRYTEDIANFVKQASWREFPSNVQAIAKMRLMDAIGVGIFASQTPWGRIVTDYAKQYGGTGESTLWGKIEKKVNPPSAALANGTCAHGFELDDVHYPSISHPGSVIVPSTLALAESLSSTGEKVLESLIIGYEIMGRIGTTIARNHLAMGFHPTGTFGTFGAAAACSKLLDLNHSQIQDAIGLAGSFASGLSQFSVTGSMVKRIHAGHASESGMKAALLAKRGFTGPREILEGKYGFCRVFNSESQAIDWNAMLEDIGTHYVVSEISVKPSAACGVLHAVIDCIQNILTEQPLEAKDIKQIQVAGHENLIHEHNVYEPDSILSAQYSLPFTVGLAVTKKIDNPKVYLNENILKDNEVLNVAKKVTTVLDEKIQLMFPKKFGAAVTIRFVDGSEIEKSVYDPKGSQGRPFTQSEMEEKFNFLTNEIIGESKGKSLIKKINKMEDVKNVKSFF